MPTYTYQCDSCGERFDARQRFSDDPLEVCRICETKGSIHRVIQATGIIFKGSGFYVTDNSGASKSTAPTNGNSSAETNGTSAKSESNGTSTKAESNGKENGSTPTAKADKKASSTDSSKSKTA